MLLWAGFHPLGADVLCPILALAAQTVVFVFFASLLRPSLFVSTGRFYVNAGQKSRPYKGVKKERLYRPFKMASADESTYVDEKHSSNYSSPNPNLLYAFTNIYTCWTGW